MTKKVRNIFESMIDKGNIEIASQKAQKGKKSRQIDVFNSGKDAYIELLHNNLLDQSFKPGQYRTVIIHDPKERVIKIAPFYPDRIVHHVLMNVIEPIFNAVYVYNSYACVKGKGGHLCVSDLYKSLQNDCLGTQYCLKIDIKKFYDNIDHDVLKEIISRKINDAKALQLIGQIIDSTEGEKGIPIGNYTSQHFANLYLSYFDHYCKEQLKIKHYFRYMDDIVILGHSKPYLQSIFRTMSIYLDINLKLTIKSNWQIFPVESRQIDFCGYRVNHHGIMLRKRILYNYFHRLNKLQKKKSINTLDDLKKSLPSHYGWLMHTSEKHFHHITNKSANGKN